MAVGYSYAGMEKPEGSHVENELPVDENYKARLLALLDKIEQEAPQQVEDAFVYNAWQA
jgi:hypothetical protein